MSPFSRPGIWWAILASVAAGMVLSLAYYFSGRWRTPIVRPGPRVPAPAES